MVAQRMRCAMRQTSQVLIDWLQSHGIQPSELCKGTPALQALQKRLLEDFNTTYGYKDVKGNLVNLFSGEILVHRDDARNYLWGSEVKVIVEQPEDPPPASTDPIGDYPLWSRAEMDLDASQDTITFNHLLRHQKDALVEDITKVTRVSPGKKKVEYRTKTPSPKYSSKKKYEARK